MNIRNREQDLAREAGARYIERNRARTTEKKPSAVSEDRERLVTRLKLKGYTNTESEALITMSQSAAAGPATLERIIEESDLTPVEFFLKGMACARAVGRIVIRGASGVEGYGTGFRISPDLIMTNNHVLSSEQEAQGSTIEFDYLSPIGGRKFAVVECALDPGRFFETDPDLDFTIVALAPGAPLSTRGWFPLIRESGKAVKGEPVNILQHPGGDPLSIAFRNNPIVDVLDNFLHYSTDTLPGSSGSPVANDGWHLAALHHSGVPAMDPVTKAILKLDGTPYRDGEDPALIRWIANEGVRISRIVAHLDGLNLNGGKAALYLAAFSAPPIDVLFNTWQASANEAASGAGAGGGGGTGWTPGSPGGGQGPDGKARWFFELSFGPAGEKPSITPPPASATASTAPKAPTPAPVRAAAKGEGEAAIREAARRLLSQENSKDYYDPTKARKDAAAYLKPLKGLKDAALLDAMQELLTKTHKPVNSYAEARIKHLYPRVDRYPDRKLRSVYSGKIMDAEELIVEELTRLARVTPQLIESLTSGGGLKQLSSSALKAADTALERLEAEGSFNCEHVVPQSWFDKREPMRSDLHHLFTCESNCNSFRGNIPYHDFEDYEPVAEPDEADRKLCGKRERAGDRQGFEPEHGKGAVARATLYFMVRYPGLIGDRDTEFDLDQTPTLVAWHHAHPTTDWERHRNEAIFAIQGNRNPFIDDPDLVDMVFE